MVRVTEACHGDGPSHIPVESPFINQQSHQLRHADGGVRVVELHGKALGEAFDRYIGQVEQTQHVLQRAGHEEILLRQAQPLADRRFVVGIEHLGHRFRDQFFVHRLVVIADVERLEVERLDRLGTPQPQRIAGVDAITLDRRIVCDALHHSVRYPAHALTARSHPGNTRCGRPN